MTRGRNHKNNSNSNIDGGATDDWERRMTGDATLTCIDVHVTVHAPAGSPTVLHLDGVAVVSDGKHAMIQLRSATGRDGAAGVLLEHRLVGLNGNGHWVGIQGALQTRGAAA